MRLIELLLATWACRASSLLTGAAAEKVAEEQGLLHLRALDTAAIKPVSGPSVLKAIPPAGFGLDFLPGALPALGPWHRYLCMSTMPLYRESAAGLGTLE